MLGSWWVRSSTRRRWARRSAGIITVLLSRAAWGSGALPSSSRALGASRSSKANRGAGKYSRSVEAQPGHVTAAVPDQRLVGAAASLIAWWTQPDGSRSGSCSGSCGRGRKSADRPWVARAGCARADLAPWSMRPPPCTPARYAWTTRANPRLGLLPDVTHGDTGNSWRLRFPIAV